MKKINITVIGCGNVGSTIAKELLDLAFPAHINVLDINEQKLALVNDMNQASSKDKTISLSFNDMALFAEADYVFMAAAQAATTIGDRLDKAQGHIDMARDIFGNVSFKNDPYIIVISNPVDVMTYHIHKIYDFKNEKIIGTGTYLETFRYQYFLKEFFKTDHDKVEGYLLGEHGNSAVPIYSQTKINGSSVDKDLEKAKQASKEAIEAPYNIRRMGEYTKYAISKCAVNIFKALYENKSITIPAGLILNDENCTLLNCEPVCLSTLVDINEGKFIQHSLKGLNENEIEDLKKSAKILMAFNDN